VGWPPPGAVLGLFFTPVIDVSICWFLVKVPVKQTVIQTGPTPDHPA